MPKTMIVNSRTASEIFLKASFRGDFLKQAHVGESWVTKRQASPP